MSSVISVVKYDLFCALLCVLWAQFLHQFTLVPGLAFPDNYYFPAELLQTAHVSAVAFDIPAELLLPEGLIAFRRARLFAAFVTVPETSPDFNDGFIFRQHNIRLSRQIFPVQPETIPHSMQQ